MRYSIDKKPVGERHHEAVIELKDHPQSRDIHFDDMRSMHSEKHDDNSEYMEDTHTETNVSVRGTQRQASWWRLHPLLRALILVFTFGCLFAAPAIIVGAINAKHISMFDNSILADNEYYVAHCVVRWFTWCTFTWVTGVFIFHLVDSTPSFAVSICKFITGSCTEQFRNRLGYFMAASVYTKITIIAALAMASFAVIFPNSSPAVGGDPEHWTRIVFQIISCVCIASVVLFIEKVVLQVVAAHFHRTAYKERITDLEYSLWVLDRLDGARRQQNDNAFVSPFNWGRRPQDDNNASTARLNSPNGPRSRTASNATQADGGNKTPGIIQPFSFVANTIKNVGKQAMNADVDINSTARARKLATKLFDALQGSRDYLTMRDFIPYFKTQKDAEKAFGLFDKDGNGDVSKREMREKIIAIYKERRDLNASMMDMSQIVRKLDRILIVVCLVLIVILVSMVFGQSPGASLVSFGTIFVAWSFVFGGALKNMFECLIFLFVIHPFDAGDLVTINGQTMTVKKVHILTTVFTGGNGNYIVAPNSVLVATFIHNLRRSPPQSESIALNLDFYTPEEKLHALRERLDEFVAQYPRIFVAGVGFTLSSIVDANQIVITVLLNYKHNAQIGTLSLEGRDKFMHHLRNQMIALNIRCHGLVQPVQLLGPPPRYEDLSNARGPSDDGPSGSGSQDPFGRNGSRDDSNLRGNEAALHRSHTTPVTQYNHQNAEAAAHNTTANQTAAAATGLFAANAMFGF
ncbi:hypothetical protein H4R35_000348 [Dimargaris xerosporica]|nr:hypothetical protein H4R35_000348 [Dimargaris xerosporica]